MYVHVSCRHTTSTAMIWRWYVQSCVLGSTQMLYNAKEEESVQHSTQKKLGKLTSILLLLMQGFIPSLCLTWFTVKR